MICIDSSGWVEYFSGGATADEYEKYITEHAKIGVSAIVAYETYKRIFSLRGKDRADFSISMMQKYEFIPVTMDISLLAVQLALQYELGMADAMIYATSQLHGAKLITSDSDLKGLPGVIYFQKKK